MPFDRVFYRKALFSAKYSRKSAGRKKCLYLGKKRGAQLTFIKVFLELSKFEI